MPPLNHERVLAAVAALAVYLTAGVQLHGMVAQAVIWPLPILAWAIIWSLRIAAYGIGIIAAVSLLTLLGVSAYGAILEWISGPAKQDDKAPA